MRLPIAREGAPFILPPAVLSAVLFAVGGMAVWFGLLFLLLALFCAFFFRDPERPVPAGEGIVVSPADGKVVRAGPLSPGEADAPEDARLVLSIFLSVMDIHVNRSPASGTIDQVVYRPGRFLPAFRPSASVENERNEVRLRTAGGFLSFRQIAGVLARRVVFRPREGDRVERGQRVGLIRFGSRMDLFLRVGYGLSVEVGDRVRAGETIVARKIQEPGTGP